MTTTLIEQLQECAAAKDQACNPFWYDRARLLMQWAIDTIEAANVVIDAQQTDIGRILDPAQAVPDGFSDAVILEFWSNSVDAIAKEKGIEPAFLNQNYNAIKTHFARALLAAPSPAAVEVVCTKCGGEGKDVNCGGGIETCDLCHGTGRRKQPAPTPAGVPIRLKHMAYADEDGLQWMSGRRAVNCELYAMPDFGRAPDVLYTNPTPDEYEEVGEQYLVCTPSGDEFWAPIPNMSGYVATRKIYAKREKGHE